MPTPIDRHELQRLLDEERAQLVEVLPPAEFTEEHLPRAINIPLASGADLDFFGLTAAAVDRLVPAVDRALREASLVVHHIQVNPGFARPIVESADDRTEVDVAADARLFPAEPGRPPQSSAARSWRSTKCSPCSDERKHATSST